MKNLLLLMELLFMTTSCFAATNSFGGGFQDTTNANLTTVSQAIKMNDNTYLKLQGTLEKQISDDKYIFKDSTGTMTIEIDSDKWAGQVIRPGDKIEISGEVEKKFNSIKVDVDSVKKITK